jgi:hypothetical protein
MTTTTPAAPAATDEKALAPQRGAIEAFEADDPRALYMNTGLFEQLQRVALMMSAANVVPEHLRGKDKLSDCFLVVSQAFRWGFDPFAVAQCTYVLKGKLGYEGKLIAAVVNMSGKLAGPLSYAYSGAGKDRRVVVSGHFKGEDAARTIEGTVGLWATQNEQWTKAADQMLAYRGAREWARRHMPEAVLGVQAEEEVIDVTPEAEAVEAQAKGLEGVKARLLESTREREPGSDDGPELKLTPPKGGK